MFIYCQALPEKGRHTPLPNEGFNCGSDYTRQPYMICNLPSVLFPKISCEENASRMAKNTPRNGENAAILKVKFLSKGK